VVQLRRGGGKRAALPDKDRDGAVGAGELRRFSQSDLGPAAGGCYANVGAIGNDPSLGGVEVFDSSKPAGAPTGSLSRVDCFRAKFAAQVASGTVPALNYLVLTNDHTGGLQPVARTPFAMVADNDLALGQIVDAISHSPIWSSSAIFVVEDDSQDAVPQHAFDNVLWRYVHGPKSKPPPAGPNAVAGPDAAARDD
jgi:hypothetical protein